MDYHSDAAIMERLVNRNEKLKIRAERMEVERNDAQYQLSCQTYNGNSIGYIHQKMVAYGRQSLLMGNALRDIIKCGEGMPDPTHEIEIAKKAFFDIEHPPKMS